MGDDLNTRCTTALRALEAAGVIGPKWRDGRLMANGCRILGQLPTEPGVWYVADPVNEGPDCRIVYQEHMTTHLGWVIDLSDAREAASLIVPVREAWGDPKIHTRFSESKGMWEVVRGRDKATQPMRWPGDKRGRIISDAALEAEALVAALEARVAEITN